MKKIILSLAAVAISGITYAQTDSVNRTNQNPSDMNRQQMETTQNGYRMQNGKMMVSKGGKLTAMDKDIIFNDGSVLKSDGTLIRKDGTKQMINDRDYVDLTGKVVRSDKKNDMYLVPDSNKNKYNK
jgi:hypothetical protein